MRVTTPRLISSDPVRLVAISLRFFVGRLTQTIEDIILRHSARGMTRLAPELPCDYCAEAAREIVSWPRGTAALLTGFDVGGSPETDGPTGTYVVAKALIDLGFSPIVVSEHPTCAYFSELGVKTCEVSSGCGVHGDAARCVGATGRRELSVDGFGLDVERKIVEALLCA